VLAKKLTKFWGISQQAIHLRKEQVIRHNADARWHEDCYDSSQKITCDAAAGIASAIQ